MFTNHNCKFYWIYLKINLFNHIKYFVYVYIKIQNDNNYFRKNYVKRTGILYLSIILYKVEKTMKYFCLMMRDSTCIV